MNYYKDIIKDNLNYHNLKIKDLANLTGVTEKHISEILSGKANPSYDLTLKLEKVFGIPENTLFIFGLKLEEINLLKKDKNINKIFEKIKSDPKNKLVDKVSVLQKISRTFRGSFNGFKQYLQSASVDFFKYKDEPVAYYWIAQMDKKYGDLNSSGSFKKSLGDTVIKNVLDILFDKTKIEDRIDKVEKYLDGKGIILKNSPFIQGSNINGCVLKKDKQYFIFMNDKQKREYQYIFALVHELMHIYKNHNDNNDEVAKEIRAYENKYNKSHKELDLAMGIFESNELIEVKWELLRAQTKLKLKFK